MPNSLANPLPDPAGNIAKHVLELINVLPISLTDPSPPTAVIILNLSMFCFAISMACFAFFVYSIL